MNNISKIENKIISINDSVISALKQMDGHRTKLVFVFDKDKFEGILTIGDIQRAIIRQANLSDPVSAILVKDKIYASENDSLEQIKTVMFKELIDCMPVLNADGEIVDVLFWHDVFTEKVEDNRPKIDLPVVIMAGGKGTRLYPYTKILPKPLIPIGDIPIMERIIDKFRDVGVTDFYATVNYRKNMIKSYFTDTAKDYEIQYVEENQPLGRA